MKPLPCSKLGRAAVILSCLFLIGCSARSQGQNAKKPAATNEYHGIKVVDEFQWLENANDPTVQQWSASENAKARSVLDNLPTRPLIEDRLTRLLTEGSTNYSSLIWRKGKLFMLKFQPPAQQPLLITLDSITNLASEKVVLDPNQLSADGSTSIDWYVPSWDGKLAAISLSERGSELGTLYFYDTETGQKRVDIVTRVNGPTAGGSVAWNADGSGVFYTRYPHKGDRPDADLAFYQQVYFHKLGTPEAQDTYEIGKEFPRIAEVELEARTDGRYLMATVSNGDGGEYAHYLRESSDNWRQITRFEDKIKSIKFGRDPLYIEWGKDETMYLLSRATSPFGEILRLPLARPQLTNAYVFVDASTNEVIQDFFPSASGMCFIFLKGGPCEFGYFDYFANIIRVQPNRIPTAIQEVVVTQGDEVLFRTETFTEPYVWSVYNPTRDAQRIDRTIFSGHSPVSFSDVEVLRQTVISKDGTKVPLNIVRKRGTRMNGENPTLLSGYGGYGVSITPEFDVTRRVWLDQGGVLAIANLRGGGEFGENWHHAGALTNKQNVFNDFAACAEFLIRSNYTKPSKLAVEGGSNGGLLMGALLTQRPELMQAVVSHVGIYDMLRVERDPNGEFNVTEFGTVKDPDQFRALYGYSPYHRVADKTYYPSVLMLTGEHDGRVNPAHSRKMVARLQSATTSSRPILLRTSSKTGHGHGTALNEWIQQLTDVYSFLFEQLGIEYSVIDRGPWAGGVSPNSALVKAKLVREGMNARLLLSKTPALAEPISFGLVPSQAEHANVVAFPLANLDPDTQYYYGLEINGRLDKKKRGQFRTFPAPGPASFKMAWASCARTGSTGDVFDRIRENQPLFYINVGDFHYSDIRTNVKSLFRAAYDAVLASPQQADLYRNVPFDYVWDDHDFGGNSATGKSTTHEAARSAYEEYVPHYPLVFGQRGPIAHSFSVGRVKFIVTDLRSKRDDPRKKDGPDKSMMGAEQKEWFKKELLEANGKYPLICWMSSVPWIGTAGTNVYAPVKTNQFGFIHHTNLVYTPRTNVNRGGFGERRTSIDEDHWSVFTHERREIADFIKSNHISGVCILHGDSHMLAADDGTYSDYATGGGMPFPVMGAAPLDRDPSLKGGPYSQGVYRVRDKEGEGCFGLLFVDDKGDHIDVRFSGRNHKNDEKISLKFTVPASKRVAQSEPDGGK
jgi:prolyl oligopeptidase